MRTKNGEGQRSGRYSRRIIEAKERIDRNSCYCLVITAKDYMHIDIKELRSSLLSRAHSSSSVLIQSPRNACQDTTTLSQPPLPHPSTLIPTYSHSANHKLSLSHLVPNRSTTRNPPKTYHPSTSAHPQPPTHNSREEQTCRPPVQPQNPPRKPLLFSFIQPS